EFAAAHSPVSYNVPRSTLREHCDELRGSLESVVLVCQTGNRAAQAERVLGRAGLTGVRVLHGGIAAWDAVGAPLNRGRVGWTLEQQVRLVAGILVLAGVLGGAVVPGLVWLAAAFDAGIRVAALNNTSRRGWLLAPLPFNREPVCSSGDVAAMLRDR